MNAVEESRSAFQRHRNNLNQQFNHHQNQNHNHNKKIDDEEVNSDMDSEDGLDFNVNNDDDITDEIKTCCNGNTTAATIQPSNVDDDGDTSIHELVVRRIQKTAVQTTKNCTNDNKSNNNHNLNRPQVIIDNDGDHKVKETKTQKFKRLEKNWSKSRRYSNPWDADGVLAEYGKLYERHQEEIKRGGRKKKTKKKSTKSKKKKQSDICESPQKEQEFCFKLGTIKIHLENENLDGVKPEDIIPFVSKHVC